MNLVKSWNLWELQGNRNNDEVTVPLSKVFNTSDVFTCILSLGNQHTIGLATQTLARKTLKFSFIRISRVFIFSGPWLFALPPNLAPNLCLPALAPNFYLPVLAPNLYLPALAPNLCLPVLAHDFITSLRPEFTYTNLVSSIYICITGLGPEFAFTFLIIGSSTSSSGSSDSSSSNFFGTNNTNICMPILIN